MDNRLYLKPKDVADIYGVTLATVRRWIEQGALAAIKTPGGHNRIVAKKFYALLHKPGQIAPVKKGSPSWPAY